MKSRLFFHGMSLPKLDSRMILIIAFLAITLVFSAMFTSSAHAMSTATRINTVADAPSAIPGPPYTLVYVWASHVNVRSCPSTNCGIIGTIPIPTNDVDACQTTGQWVSYGGYSNNWWSFVAELDDAQLRGGYISNIFIQGGQIIANVPTQC